MINTKLQSIIDTKSAIGNAIVNKGGTITSETPFFNYAAQIDGISTGTPQTIFAASDGSKWALTNAVNLVNDAGNVTSDFNYWQPANNSTSDPILNVGTVDGNISGNIKIVQVNQVNISQYVNLVATDTDGGKYEGFNGYDANTNPTPTGNTTFNRWLLNNSASGTVIFANTTIVNGGTFNGPNTVINEASMPFVDNTANYGATILSVTTNNGFIYAGGLGNATANRDIKKYYESNLAFVSNSAAYGGTISSITTNNGFIYAGGSTNQKIQKFFESNLARATGTNVSNDYGGTINDLKINNGFIYAGGTSNRTVQKFYEDNLAFVGNTADYGGSIRRIAINNGFIYVGGITNFTVQKFHESNLAFVGNTASYGLDIVGVTTNNGFIYVGGGGDEGNGSVAKYYESNLAFVNNTANYGGEIRSIVVSNGFIYAGGQNNNTVQKFYDDNLAFVGNTTNYNGAISTVAINNGFIYAGGGGNPTIKKYQTNGTTFDNQTFYTATKIKE
jgi:hypothetical protein